MKHCSLSCSAFSARFLDESSQMANKTAKTDKTESKTVTKKVLVQKNPLKQALRVVYWLVLLAVATVVAGLLFDAYWTYYSNTR